jgi:hypothetical protein
VPNVVIRLSSDVYLNLDFESIDSKIVAKMDSLVNMNVSIDDIASKGTIDGNVNCSEKKDNFSVDVTTTMSP